MINQIKSIISLIDVWIKIILWNLLLILKSIKLSNIKFLNKNMMNIVKFFI